MTAELILAPESCDTLPKWIFYFGSLLATIGIVARLLGVVSPTKFFSDFPTFTQ